ncbi:hypothetical protein CAOG_001617 [Capsaspora owczarzaki ATCC 30864]|uniref:Uncharacterized protein n=1 Tax=Capsaspora owczarzaki (strain ATCC 30864) TaxID=595528 RepID=A0A0D2X168_CAPO3|nr:hypothetical protein CAOG_001617 [Capsaspora owczarzaki ATCC 30864]
MESDYVETSPGSGVLQHYANGSSKAVGFRWSCRIQLTTDLDENWLAGGIVHYVVHPTVADMTIAEFQAELLALFSTQCGVGMGSDSGLSGSTSALSIGGSSTVSGKTMDAMTIAAAPNCIKPVLAALRTHVNQYADVDPTRALVSSMVHDNLALRQFSLDDAMQHEDLCWYLYCATLQTTFSLGALQFRDQVNDFLVGAEVKTDKPSHPASSEPTMRT